MQLPILLLTAAVSQSGLLNYFTPVACEGNYQHHLQGVCTTPHMVAHNTTADGKQKYQPAIYWSFTTKLVKTDTAGIVLGEIPVGYHHGDVCVHDGKIYCAVNFGKFNHPEGLADGWVYVYDQNLELLAKHRTPEVTYGAGGIACDGKRFLVVGGLPDGVKENYVYEYDLDFKFVRKHVLPSGHTLMGIQTATFADGQWWFGCYGNPAILLKADRELKQVERFKFNASLGITPVGPGRFLVAVGPCSKESGCTGRLVLASVDREDGIKLEPEWTLESFREKVTGKMTPAMVTETFGRPHCELGSGLMIWVYALRDGSRVSIGFPGMAPAVYITHTAVDGARTDLIEK